MLVTKSKGKILTRLRLPPLGSIKLKEILVIYLELTRMLKMKIFFNILPRRPKGKSKNLKGNKSKRISKTDTNGLAQVTRTERAQDRLISQLT